MGEAKRKAALREQLLSGTAPPPAAENNSPIAAQPAVNGRREVTKVAVVLPSMSWVNADYSMSLAGLTSHSVCAPVGLAIIAEKSSMISKARNSLAERALEIDPHYILSVDTDLVFPPDALLRLLSHNKDIVGATYNKRVPPFETLGHFMGPARDLSSGGLIEADYLPGGFMLVKADVYRKLTWPFYFECYRRPGLDLVANLIEHLKDTNALEPPADLVAYLESTPSVKAWLEESAKGEFGAPGAAGYLSEDYAFCRKARRYGYQIWCDLDLSWEMRHVGERHVTCNKPLPAGTVPVPTRQDTQLAMIDLNKAI